MSLKTNRALVRRWVDEVINGSSAESMRELALPNFINNIPRQYPNLAGAQDILEMLHVAFPDIHFEIEDMLADGDRVAVRFVITGTHTNLVIQDVRPAGKRITFNGMHIFRIEGNRIAEAWGVYDELGLYHQLGVLPMPGQALAS